jgi:hypothetical protein
MKLSSAIKRLKKSGFEVNPIGDVDDCLLATCRWYSAINPACVYKIKFLTRTSKLTALKSEESVEIILCDCPSIVLGLRKLLSSVHSSATIANAINHCLFLDSVEKQLKDAILLDSQKLQHDSIAGCSKHGASVHNSH